MTIIYIILAILIVFTIKLSIKNIKKDGYTYLEFINEIYTKGFICYIYAFGLFLILITLALTISINMEYIPSFFKWSYFSLFNEPSTNVVLTPIVKSKNIFGEYQILFIGLFYIVLILVTPLLAYSEEVSFRSLTTGFNHILRNSFIFALVHIPMGIPLFIIPILFIIGIIFSLIYRKKFLSYDFSEKTIYEDVEKSNKIATMYVSRIHTIYNLLSLGMASIIVTFVC